MKVGAIVFSVAAILAGFYALQTIQKRRKKSPSTRTYRTKEDVAKAVCAYVVESAKVAIATRGVFHMSVAEGCVLDALTRLREYKDAVEWEKVVLSFANHMCVPLNSDKAIFVEAKAKFADAIGIKKIVATSGSPDGEADYYAKALFSMGVPHEHGFPVLDLVLTFSGSTMGSRTSFDGIRNSGRGGCPRRLLLHRVMASVASKSLGSSSRSDSSSSFLCCSSPFLSLSSSSMTSR